MVPDVEITPKSFKLILPRMDFPEHFPKNCPPEDASDVQGELFRFVSNNPPQANDFVSHHLQGRRYKKANMCVACGLSVHITEAEVKEARETTPFFRKLFVAKGRLSPEWGKIASTLRNSHHTWWVPEGKSPEILFDVIEVK